MIGTEFDFLHALKHRLWGDQEDLLVESEEMEIQMKMQRTGLTEDALLRIISLEDRLIDEGLCIQTTLSAFHGFITVDMCFLRVVVMAPIVTW